MSAGSIWLRISTFGFFSFGIALLVMEKPDALQQIANALFFFVPNAQDRVYSLAAALVSLALFLWVFAERSIGNAAVSKSQI